MKTSAKQNRKRLTNRTEKDPKKIVGDSMLNDIG